jgi:hypothetical protein
MFFSATPYRESTDSAQPTPNPVYGDICAIEYRMTYGPLFPVNTTGSPVFALHRAVVNAKSTMLGLLTAAATQTPGVTTGNIVLQMGNPSTNLLYAWSQIDSVTGNGTSDTPLTILNPATSTGTTAGSMYVYGGLGPATTMVYNVAQFMVTLNFYDTTQASGISAYSYSALVYGGNSTIFSASGLTPVSFPNLPSTISPNAVYDYSGGKTPTEVVSTNPPPYNLAYADVSLTLITDEGAALFAQSPQTYMVDNGSGISAWKQFLLKYGRTFTERVYFQNTPQ